MTYVIAFLSAFALFVIIGLWSLFELHSEQRRSNKQLEVDF